MPDHDGIAYPGQHIGNRVGDYHSCHISSSRLPAGFSHSRELGIQRQVPETNAADAELAYVGAGATADLAAVMFAHGELGRPLRF
jgi:hypothetical protein